MISVEASLLGGVGVRDTCPNVSTGWPDVFGPPIWWSFHVIGEHYPQRASQFQRESCEKFIGGTVAMLPCEACGEHFGEFALRWTRSNGSMCTGKENLKRFFCEAHNEVNAYNGKPTRSCCPISLAAQYASYPLCVPQVPN